MDLFLGNHSGYCTDNNTCDYVEEMIKMVRQNIYAEMDTHFTNGNVDTKTSGSRKGQTGSISIQINTDTDGNGVIQFHYNQETKKVDIVFDDWFERKIREIMERKIENQI